MNHRKVGNVLVPVITSGFKKKIRVVIPLQKKDVPDYRESPTRFFPFTKDHPTVYDSPYMTQYPYYGIRTDIRWYDYIREPIIGTKPSELY